MRSYGFTPDDVTALPSGAVAPGVQLTVWDAPTAGAQVLDLLDADEAPLPGYVLSGPDGAYGWKHDGTFDYLYASADAGVTRWAVQAHEALSGKLDAQVAADTYATPYSVTAFAPLKRALAEAGTRPVAVQVLGDSTGNDSYEWPTLFAQYLAGKNPAWTVRTRLWNDTTQAYDAPVTVQTGPAGEQYLQGAAGQITRRVSPGAIQHITGVMDVRLKLAADSWTNAAVALGRENGAGQRSWWVAFTATGAPTFVVSSDGTALATLTGTANVPFAPGAVGWVRWVYTPDNGSGSKTLQTYTSTDGLTWTALGSLVTSAGAVVPFNTTTAAIDVGGRGGATGLPGKYYEVQVRNGVDGPNTVPALVGSWVPTPVAGTPMTLAGSPVLTIVNGSKPGADLAYLNDSTRLPKMTPNYGQTLIMLSDSHNESTRQDNEFLSLYDAWVTAVQARFVGVPVVVLTQNPQNGAVSVAAHAARRGNLLTYARAKGVDVIDTYRAFLLDPRGIPALMADTIHPNVAGAQLWFDQISAQYAVTPA